MVWRDSNSRLKAEHKYYEKARCYCLAMLATSSVQCYIKRMLELRDDLVIEDRRDYYALVDIHDWRVVNSGNLFASIGRRNSQADYPFMGIRLSSGMLGELDCPAVANNPRVPKGYNEVIFGIGEKGVAALIDFGGLPCPVCRPAERLQKIGAVVMDVAVARLGSENNLSDGNFLNEHYDARRLDWHLLTKRFGITPSQFTTRSEINPGELAAIRSIFQTNALAVPDVGYYDPDLKRRVSFE